jgi:hypothetical protein
MIEAMISSFSTFLKKSAAQNTGKPELYGSDEIVKILTNIELKSFYYN